MRFAEYTKKIISKLPYWFSIKKKSSISIGAQFLDVIGLELDEMMAILDYAYDQLYIDRADLNALDVCYKVLIPDININDITGITAGGSTLTPIDNLNNFVNGKYNVHTYEQFKDVDGYYIDKERKIIYVKKPHDSINIITENHVYIKTLQIHNVWNYFDELGLILDCARLNGEKNIDYKNRIKGVFKYPSSSTKSGLANGIARELGTRVYVKLDNTLTDIKLPHDMVMLDTITFNSVPVDKDRIMQSIDGKVVIKGDGNTSPQELSYIYGLDMHLMYQYDTREDKTLDVLLFNTDGTTTEYFKDLIYRINSLCPIMWNYARWDEAFWIDNIQEFGSLPNVKDAGIKGFLNYNIEVPQTIAKRAIVGTFLVGELLAGENID